MNSIPDQAEKLWDFKKKVLFRGSIKKIHFGSVSATGRALNYEKNYWGKFRGLNLCKIQEAIGEIHGV